MSNADAIPSGALSADALEQLFLSARTVSEFEPRPVPRAVLESLYSLVRLGPTSANCSPGRFVFVTSPEAKETLAPHLSSNNRAKALAAPVNVIVAYDPAFAEKLSVLNPRAPGAAAWFGASGVAEETAFRNSSLQGGYLILVARALGLDCGPLSGFNRAGVDEAFFKDTRLKSNFICNIGYGVHEGLPPRLPRLEFEEACQVL